MFVSALPNDIGLLHNVIKNPNNIFYRDPKYTIFAKPQNTQPKPLMLDSRIVNNSKFQDGFIVANHASKPVKAYHVDPKYRTRSINENALSLPNMKRVNFLTMNTIKPDVITDLSQKPTFQLYVQIIRQIYKRMMDDITASDQQVLNSAFESFQKDYVNKNKNKNMNDVQLDNMINNYISKVKEVFMRWYDTSDKSFNPVLTLESGTVLEEIATNNNDELLETLKNRDNLEENLKVAEVEAEVIALRDATVLLEEEKKKNDDAVLARIDNDAKTLAIEEQKVSDLEAIIDAKSKELKVAEDLIATENKVKATHYERLKDIGVEEKDIKQNYQNSTSMSDAKARKAVQDVLDDKTIALNKEKKLISDDLAALSSKTKGILATKKALEEELDDKAEELDDINNAIIAKKATDAKDTKALKADTERENKTLEKEFEKKAEPILKGLAKFNADRKIQNALKEKVIVIKDRMSDTRLKEVYNTMPKEFRDPENKEFELKYREAVRKVFLDKDKISVPNDPRRFVYKNNYERFKTLAKDNLLPANLYSDIYDNIGGTTFNEMLNDTKIKTEYKKLTGKDPKPDEIANFQRFAINQFATPKKAPTRSPIATKSPIVTKSPIATRGKAKSKVP